MPNFLFNTPDGATYKFAKIDNLATFVNGEADAWEWLNQYRNTSPNQWLIDSILTPLQNAKSYLSQQPASDELVEMATIQLKLYFESTPAVHPKSVLRQIVNKVVQRSVPEAIYMIATIGQSSGKWGHFSDQLGVQSSYIAGIARGLAIVEGWNQNEKSMAASQSAETSASAAGEALTKAISAKDEAEATLRFFMEWETGHRERMTLVSDTARNDHEALTQKLIDSALLTTQNLEDDWKKLAGTYDSQLALRAPATYWGKKHKRHTNWVTALALGGFLWLIIGVFSLHGLAKSVFGLTTIGTVPTWFQVISFSLGALVFVLVLRSLLRLMMSHVHLSLDAAERQTMIVSYLALVRKGSLKEETLEKVLGAIFRPTGDGIVKDEGVPLSVFSELFKKP